MPVMYITSLQCKSGLHTTIFLSPLISDNFIFSWNEDRFAVCILFESLLHSSNAWIYLSKHREWHKNSINVQHMWDQMHYISNSINFIVAASQRFTVFVLQNLFCYFWKLGKFFIIVHWVCCLEDSEHIKSNFVIIAFWWLSK